MRVPLFSPLSYLSNFQLRSRLFPISMQMLVDGKLSLPTTDLINSRPSCFDASSLGLCTLKHFKTTSSKLVRDWFNHILRSDFEKANARFLVEITSWVFSKFIYRMRRNVLDYSVTKAQSLPSPACPKQKRQPSVPLMTAWMTSVKALEQISVWNKPNTI